MYEIVERSIDKRGQYLFPADVEINMWDVNVDFSDHDVIALYQSSLGNSIANRQGKVDF